jgi:Animal haem peroxidase
MSATGGPEQHAYSRKSFLARLGVGAVAVGSGGIAGVGRASAAADHIPEYRAINHNHFTRIFPKLRSFASQDARVENALKDIGKPGGLLDARDALDKGPVLLITDPSLSAGNRNNPDHTAGTTFFGQFIDHDITFDISSRLGRPQSPQASPNGRTAALDLDSLYGAGPIASQQLYDPTDRAKLRSESGGKFEDLPRTADNTAILGDPRNDEHVIIAGLHSAFILFHNKAVELLRSDGVSSVDGFARARRLTTWHYHWLVLHEFLPLIVGQTLVDDVLNNGARFYRPKKAQAMIPVEFQAAVYRFGHSMVRPSYRANLAGDNGDPFFGMIFDPSQGGKVDPADLRGGARAPRRFVGWQTFFDFGDGQVKPNKRIDTKLSTPLFDLPLGAIASHDPPTSLAERTLLRHLTWKLPSGQRIARAMGVTPLAKEDLTELSGYGLGLDRSTPLFYYTLKEAELTEDGLRLGPVGGRIVAEVLIGLIRSDPASYLSVEPGWKPTVSGGAGFRMVDFLRFAEVDPVSRGQ